VTELSQQCSISVSKHYNISCIFATVRCDKRMTHPERNFSVVVVAAGTGQRFGGDVPKQYVEIAGKSLFRHTLDHVLSWDGVGDVCVVIHPDHEVLFRQATAGLEIQVVHGGAERHESVANGLKALGCADNDIVLIHDAARPFVAARSIPSLVAAVKSGVGATLAAPVRDSLFDDKGGANVERGGLWAIQTPQAFVYGDILKAHEARDLKKHYTDDTSVARDQGVDIVMVESAHSNFKITTQDDLKMAKLLLKGEAETRTGLGFDVHAFADHGDDKSLILCGVEVAHDRSLVGHSDADVGLHTITDAILGAIGKGDIGQHFPPSDDTYKDMDSAVFLKKAVEFVAEMGGALVNIDVTLICEAPKIGPYRDQMAVRIAEICGIDAARVNVKGTTTEKLGFTGRGEGIAAQAVVSVKMPVVEG